MDSYFYEILPSKTSLKMLEPILNHNTTTKVQNIYPLKSYKEKNKHLIMINQSIDTNIDNNITNYYHEKFK